MEQRGKVIIRRLALFWVLGMGGWVTYQVFSDVGKIDAQVNLAFGTFMGLATLALGYWFKKKAEK